MDIRQSIQRTAALGVSCSLTFFVKFSFYETQPTRARTLQHLINSVLKGYLGILGFNKIVISVDQISGDIAKINLERAERYFD